MTLVKKYILTHIESNWGRPGELAGSCVLNIYVDPPTCASNYKIVDFYLRIYVLFFGFPHLTF